MDPVKVFNVSEGLEVTALLAHCPAKLAQASLPFVFVSFHLAQSNAVLPKEYQYKCIYLLFSLGTDGRCVSAEVAEWCPALGFFS